MNTLKLVTWNLHKMTRKIPVRPFVMNVIQEKDADILCFVEYVDDTGIMDILRKDYWVEVSSTVSGNKVLIAVKKEVAPHGICAVCGEEMTGCYNFLHIDFTGTDGKIFSVIGIRMLSPMNAALQTPALKAYLEQMQNAYICTGDYNIRDYRMDVWFPGIGMERLKISDLPASQASIFYVNPTTGVITDSGAVDHVLHSDDVEVEAEYDWSFVDADPVYPPLMQLKEGSVWKIKPAYPDHALMECTICFI